MRRIKLVVEYDGTGLCGWQRQDNGPTVQEHLETALAEMDGNDVKVTGASRTDAGVHALGQVAHFDTEGTVPPKGFRRGLNGHLPQSIAVVAADEVDPEFHARFWSSGKRYRYRLLCRRERSPLERLYSYHVARPLDVESMRAAATALVGEHDFTSFRAADCGAKTPNRRIDSLAIEDRGGGILEIEVAGNAFLRNMVRIIAGTLVEVGEGKRAADTIAAVIEARDREAAGRTAPAHGLTLARVFYDRPGRDPTARRP